MLGKFIDFHRFVREPMQADLAAFPLGMHFDILSKSVFEKLKRMRAA